MIDLIGAPFDEGGRHKGSNLGPSAARLEGILVGLEKIGRSANDLGDVPRPSAQGTWNRAIESFRQTKAEVVQSISKGNVPIVIGGDHSNSIASISGALAAYGSDLGVVWIDAHMDFNTPESSPSGNLHGMSLAALCGLRSQKPEWNEILSQVVGSTKLDPKRIAWIGLRDVDRGEVENLGVSSGASPMTMQDVDALGIKEVWQGVFERLRSNGATAIWISFDVDSLDPVFAPGTGTAVRGGLTYREGHYLAELIHATLLAPNATARLAGVDVVEINPLIDTSNQTARVAVEWVLSLFGKTILHPLDPGRIER